MDTFVFRTSPNLTSSEREIGWKRSVFRVEPTLSLEPFHSRPPCHDVVHLQVPLEKVVWQEYQQIQTQDRVGADHRWARKKYFGHHTGSWTTEIICWGYTVRLHGGLCKIRVDYLICQALQGTESINHTRISSFRLLCIPFFLDVTHSTMWRLVLTINFFCSSFLRADAKSIEMNEPKWI